MKFSLNINFWTTAIRSSTKVFSVCIRVCWEMHTDNQHYHSQQSSQAVMKRLQAVQGGDCFHSCLL